MDIQLKNIKKTFSESAVVNDFSCHLPAGKVVGLLGPNGAGKTTTIRMILNILKPDSGEITYDNDPFSKKVRFKIGYLPEERGIYQPYKVIDVLTYLGKLNGMGRRKSHVEIVRLLDRFNLIDVLEKPVQHLSKGQQQVIQYVAANLHDPELLILDEPFNGLDPLNQEVFEKHLQALKENERTILISTHRLSEAEILCDSFLMLNEGHLILTGTLPEIQKKYCDDIVLVESDDNFSLLNDLNGLSVLEVNENCAKIKYPAQANPRKILEEIIQTISIRKIELQQPGLKEVFLSAISEYAGGRQ